jgi:phenylpyruvate tautomerase PptA (4-oxalocrotonate tautomerase family)
MPLIECTLIKGYDAGTRQILAERMTDAACSSIGADPDFIIVTINEVDGDNYMRGRIHRNPAKAPEQAEDIVRTFLKAMEEHDLTSARLLLADGFEMTFPGNAKFSKLEELVAWSKGRYSSIGKTFEGFDTSFRGREEVVTCHGTLNGIWLDGSNFSGIRFMDRFTLSNGKITSQQVWNDLAVARS